MLEDRKMKQNQRTQSIWFATAKDPPRLGTFRGHVDVDVAIVGAGITGLTAATLLKKAGLTVAVLEREEFGNHGTTHRTSAHLTAALDQEYPTLIRRFGEEKTRMAVQASMAAIDLIEQLGLELEIKNDFVRVDGYRYTEKEDEVSTVEKDFDAALKLGLEGELVRALPLDFPIQRGYRLKRQAQFHPLKHIFGLAEFVDGDGSYVFHKSPVRDYECGDRCTLHLDNGTVTSREIILATHTPMGVWTTLQTRLVPYHSYCIAVRVKREAPAGLFWDSAEPYHYTRRYSQDEGNILIVGGADNKTGQVVDTRKQFERLEYYASQRLQVESIEHYWSDQFFEPADGFPYIGRAPGEKHVYIATGYSGTGLTYGTAAAMLITDLIVGRDNPWEEAFTPARLKPIASAKHIAKEAIATVQGLVTDRLKVRDKDVASIQPQEGKIISSGGERLAVFRNDKGQLHARSATCTHMGCLVEWNAAEKHWDCKCHGSLFKPDDGEPFAGPATKPLPKREVEEVPEEDARASTQTPAGRARKS
jgi:glycine/D-amino acid oxidase-like deaminating enzyme/nitrite reductase/ring-hydroxylating ferredoxin subunit